jgi:hypothetical protein
MTGPPDDEARTAIRRHGLGNEEQPRGRLDGTSGPSLARFQRTRPDHGLEQVSEPLARVLARITSTIAPKPRWRRFNARHR